MLMWTNMFTENITRVYHALINSSVWKTQLIKLLQNISIKNLKDVSSVYQTNAVYDMGGQFNLQYTIPGVCCLSSRFQTPNVTRESFLESNTAANLSVHYEYIGIVDYLFYLSNGQV